MILLLLACVESGLLVLKGDPVGETATEDTGGAPLDTGEGPLDTGEGPEPAWCLDFEDGDLAAVGYSGSFVELPSGGLVFIKPEGADFSALVGEEDLDFEGERALILRSSHAGDVDSVAVAWIPPFEVTEDVLSFWQLSEVDERGVRFTATVYDLDDVVLGSAEIPPRTGGFVPSLQGDHDPIEGLSEIGYGASTPGTLQRMHLDLADLLGLEIKIELSQHTLIEDNGFFTLLDEICLGGSTWGSERVDLDG